MIRTWLLDPELNCSNYYNPLNFYNTCTFIHNQVQYRMKLCFIYFKYFYFCFCEKVDKRLGEKTNFMRQNVEPDSGTELVLWCKHSTTLNANNSGKRIEWLSPINTPVLNYQHV